MRIVFFGTSNVALPVLEKLANHHDIAAVITQPDAPAGRKQEFAESPVSVLANEMQLKVLKPETVKGNEVFRLELEGLGADIFVVVSYGKILPESIINLPPLKTVNIHFSLLPKYRGASPIQAALLNGDKETGTTIFLLDKDMDHGPVLSQEKVTIDDDDNSITLGDKLARKSASLLMDTLHQYQTGAIVPQEQDHGDATYTSIILKSHGKVDWSRTAQEIYNQFRAFYPWPGIWTTWNGKIVKLIDVRASSVVSEKQPGTVLEGGAVACGGGTCIEISRLQLEGKNDADIASFLNGYRNFIGSILSN